SPEPERTEQNKQHETTMSVESQVESLIKDNSVVVFSKSYCPYCTRAKSALKELGADAKILELDQIDNGSAIQEYLKKKTNQSTVPNVFVKQQHIGGCDDTLAAIKRGKLHELLEVK
ncbi:hypothetical protein PROFUN_14257, partial [Planoprotostelium fungivorum]